VIENYPEGQVEDIEAVNNPEDESAGTRQVPFSRVLYIESEDFREDPPKNYFRLSPGREVRLKHAYFIRCESVVKDGATGRVVELRCTYDPASRGGQSPDGRQVKGTLHWVSAAHAVEAEVRLYDHLFATASPSEEMEEKGLEGILNPNSLVRLQGCRVEPSLAGAPPGTRFQFLRHGYFCVDPDSSASRLVFNRTVGLRDTWAKVSKQAAARS
jgi:glutaminyl-tRNA synthetase